MTQWTTAARAPAVVVVVVTKDPGPWFAETLGAIAAQDYDNVSHLVLVSGGEVDPTPVVAAILPDAFVRRLPEDRGFGVAVHEALSMVQGAPFFLLCHDDCAPSPDALHLMVEESYRSNAGIVSPKMVHWDDVGALLHVGQSIDKTGAVVERIRDGEIDAGQHDAVRDVFVAPGGCTLVRADLLHALDGYDPEVAGLGDDVDLSWRAHVAGARVVVAPAARVRHLALAASGRRPLTYSEAPSLQALQRRNELAAVLACYTTGHLLRILPQALLLALAELVVAMAYGDARRARAVLHAWRWNLSNVARVRRRRAGVRAIRVLPDADVRELQVRGSARLSGFFVGLTAQGLPRVQARRSPLGDAPGEPTDNSPALGPAARVRLPSRLFAGRRSRLVAWLVVAGLLVLGSRHLIGDPLPLVGQLLPFPSWTSAWHHLFASWEPTGTGTSAPASPAFGVLAVLGTFLFGRMGLLQEILVLGCIPTGVWGASRLLGPFDSARGRFVGALAYLALPFAYNAVARGRWDGLVAYAATPWILVQLARATGRAPFDAAVQGVAAWRRTLLGQIVIVGAIEALAMSFAPAVVVVVGICGLGVAGGSFATGAFRAAWRALAAAGGGSIVACLLCAPWAIGTFAAGGRAWSLLGLSGSAVAEPGWGGLLRLAVGPFGNSPLAWLLLAAAFTPLLVGREARLAWAVRLWGVLLISALVALVSARALAGSFAPSVDVVLAPSAIGVAACVGIGVAAFERDLSGFRFGWRQALAPVAGCVIALGMLPAIAAAAGGRWDLPATGYAGAAQLPPDGVRQPSSNGRLASYRVLWLGNPDSLPAGGWSLGTGLAYATTVDGTPQLGDLWPQASPGGTRALARDVMLAMRGRTVQLGRLLAPFGVRDVVVVQALAPQLPGSSSAPTLPLPPGMVASLSRQEDLRTVPLSAGGLVEFENTAFQVTGRNLASPGESSGAAGILDPLGGVLELALWMVLIAALLGRRRCLDWWWRPLRARQRRQGRQEVPVPAPSVTAPSPIAADGAASGDAALPLPASAGDSRR